MTKPPPTFSVSERVTHNVYGLGTIVEIIDAYTVIDFDQAGRKKFVTSMVQLEPSTVTAPPRPAPKKSRSKKAKK